MKPAWSILPEEWKGILSKKGLRSFRADQILHSLYRDYITNWDQATTLPKDFREALKTEFPLTSAETLDVSESSDGTKKLLIGFADGNSVETGVPTNFRIPNCSRHGGGDFNLVSEMIRILRRNDPDEIRETTAEALQSHLICFAAEKSRLSGGAIVEINADAPSA